MLLGTRRCLEEASSEQFQCRFCFPVSPSFLSRSLSARSYFSSCLSQLTVNLFPGGRHYDSTSLMPFPGRQHNLTSIVLSLLPRHYHNLTFITTLTIAINFLMPPCRAFLSTTLFIAAFVSLSPTLPRFIIIIASPAAFSIVAEKRHLMLDVYRLYKGHCALDACSKGVEHDMGSLQIHRMMKVGKNLCGLLAKEVSQSLWAIQEAILRLLPRSFHSHIERPCYGFFFLSFSDSSVQVRGSRIKNPVSNRGLLYAPFIVLASINAPNIQ